MRPLGSVIMGYPSCCSRIAGDMAERNRTASISWRALRKEFSMRSRVTVSSLSPLATGRAVGAASGEGSWGAVFASGATDVSSASMAAHLAKASSVALCRALPVAPFARALPNCIFDTPSTVSLTKTVTPPRSDLCSRTSEDQPPPKRAFRFAVTSRTSAEAVMLAVSRSAEVAGRWSADSRPASFIWLENTLSNCALLAFSKSSRDIRPRSGFCSFMA